MDILERVQQGQQNDEGPGASVLQRKAERAGTPPNEEGSSQCAQVPDGRE